MTDRIFFGLFLGVAAVTIAFSTVALIVIVHFLGKVW